MLNKIILMGRLTRDPELRATNSGKSVTSFTLAVDREYSKDNETDFLEIVAWEKRAEFVTQYFTKGLLVCVEGRLQRRLWIDENKQKRYAYEIIAEAVYFVEGKKKQEGSNQNQSENMPDGFDPFYGEYIA